MPENYEEFVSLSLKDQEFKETIQNARKKLGNANGSCYALQAKARTESFGATRGKSNEIKSKLACILEANESTRLRLEESWPNHHEDHIAGKGENSLQHYNWVRKFCPMPQAMKIHAAKAAVDKEWEKLEKIPAWNLTKVRSKKQVIDEARTAGVKLHFASLMDICHLKNAELEVKRKKVELYSEATSWKMILNLIDFWQYKDHQHHNLRQQNSRISCPDCQGAQDKQQIQYLLILW